LAGTTTGHDSSRFAIWSRKLPRLATLVPAGRDQPTRTRIRTRRSSTMTTDSRAPVTSGEPAPDFTLPAVDGTETVTLSGYRGQSSVFLALLLGLWCPF